MKRGFKMDLLLQPPSPHDEEFIKPFTRATATYENLSQIFYTPQERKYGLQYSHIYYVRLNNMKPCMEKAAKRKWGNDVKIKELKDLEVGVTCCIIGTIFKKMDLQPSILKEISDSHHIVPQPSRVKYLSDNDELILEDYIQRVPLIGKVPVTKLTTGIIIALLGSETTSGKFEVNDYCFAGLPPQVAPPPSLSEDKYVLLISGLNIGSCCSDQLSIQLMIDYISGQLGGTKDNNVWSHLTRIIIAGNSITDRPQTVNNKSTKSKYLSRNYSAESVEAMEELDFIIAQLASSVAVDIMPGSHDPTNNQLPQQPLHHCMFPQSSQYTTLSSVTNPYHCSIDGVRFLGTSGENINNLYCFTEGLDSLELLEMTLNWSHLAPTTPDTLGCFPYSREDPFILTESPHVYFVGNQPHFQTKHLTGDDGQEIVLVCIPTFDIQHSCVLINLGTFQCKEVSFSTSLRQKPNPELEKLSELTLHEVTVMNDLDSDDDM